MIIPLVSEKDSILSEKIEPFDFQNPGTDPYELAINLRDSMRKYGGIGLSANQVGLRHRVFVLQADPVWACFNPVITASGTEVILLEEGCLSYPNLFIKVKRPRWIRVRFTTPDGINVVRRLDGMTSRVFQHELDHLNGINFISRAHNLHREQAFRHKKKLDRQGAQRSYIIPEAGSEQQTEWC